LCYLGLDGYRYVIADDATQKSLDRFIGVVSKVMAPSTTTPAFEVLLSKVAKGKNTQNPTPVVQNIVPRTSVEVENKSNEIVVSFSHNQ